MTKQKIFKATLTLARRRGIHNVLKKHIADHLDCATGTINFHWKTMAALRKAVIIESRATEDMDLIAGRPRK